MKRSFVVGNRHLTIQLYQQLNIIAARNLQQGCIIYDMSVILSVPHKPSTLKSTFTFNLQPLLEFQPSTPPSPLSPSTSMPPPPLYCRHFTLDLECVGWLNGIGSARGTFTYVHSVLEPFQMFSTIEKDTVKFLALYRISYFLLSVLAFFKCLNFFTH